MQRASDGGCGCGEWGVADQQQPQQGGSPGDKNPSPAMSPIGGTQTYANESEETVSTHQPGEPGAGGRGKRRKRRRDIYAAFNTSQMLFQALYMYLLFLTATL